MDLRTFHSIGDGVSRARSSRTEAKELVLDEEVGFYIPMPNSEQVFWPKQVCALGTLATCCRISSSRALSSVLSLYLTYIITYLLREKEEVGFAIPGSWVVIWQDKHTGWHSPDVLSSLWQVMIMSLGKFSLQVFWVDKNCCVAVSLLFFLFVVK